MTAENTDLEAERLTGSTVNTAVVGLGHWGPNIVRNLLQSERCSLRMVCDSNPAALARFEHLGKVNCRLTGDYREIVQDEETAAVVIATPANTHYALTHQALEAGKHVLVEKPLALSVDECLRLEALAQMRGCRLMVGHTFLFNNGIRKLKELIDTDALGRIFYVTTTRTHMGPVRKDVNALWDLGPHDLSILSHLLDSTADTVTATGGYPLQSPHADYAFVTLRYPGGITAQMNLSWVDSHKERRVSVVGEKARAVFDDMDNKEPLRVYEKRQRGRQQAADFGEFRHLSRHGAILIPELEMKEPLRQMIDAFLASVLDGADHTSGAMLATDITRTLRAADRSLQEAGSPCTIEEIVR